MTASLEEYLKAIYILIQRNSFARVTDIAKLLNYSKASVNRALKVLTAEGLISYENYGDIELTDEEK
jgi:DtxR family Mn-dependent transcriptional regulator